MTGRYLHYSHPEIVKTVDPDDSDAYSDPIEVLTCDRCGALVRSFAVDLHSRWHEGTERAVGIQLDAALNVITNSLTKPVTAVMPGES